MRMRSTFRVHVFFFFNDTATTEIYTLSLHDALPICRARRGCRRGPGPWGGSGRHGCGSRWPSRGGPRSEEHTSELQSRQYLVCRLLLEKQKKVQFRLRRAAVADLHAVIPRDPDDERE